MRSSGYCDVDSGMSQFCLHSSGYSAGTLIMVADGCHGRWIPSETLNVHHRPVVLSGTDICPDRAGDGIPIKDIFAYDTDVMVNIVCGHRHLLCVPEQKFSVMTPCGEKAVKTAEELCGKNFIGLTVKPVFENGRVGYHLTACPVTAEIIYSDFKVFGFTTGRNCIYMAAGLTAVAA